MKNERKFSIVLIAIISLFSMGNVSDVFGWHDFGQKTWATSNNAYLCESNLTNITYELINPCSDLANASSTWNSVSNSNWTLTFTSGSSAPIHVKSGQVDDVIGVAEATTPISQNNRIIGADIKFDLDYGFTNSAATNSNADYFDYESIALHEFGHLQWVGHSTLNSDSVMQSDMNANTVRNVLEQHDLDVLRARY